MKIETDTAEIVPGVRHSKTIGSPIAIIIRNKDLGNWTQALPVEDIAGGADVRKPVTRPLPGHADLTGSTRYNFQDARYILERASVRETTARVAVGALAKAFLAEFGMGVLSHVIQIGEARLARPDYRTGDTARGILEAVAHNIRRLRSRRPSFRPVGTSRQPAGERALGRDSFYIHGRDPHQFSQLMQDLSTTHGGTLVVVETMDGTRYV